MPRTVVGLFNSASEAQFALERLVATGFPRPALNLATQATLRALPGAETGPPTETLEDGLVRFFTTLFAGHDPDGARAHLAATRADSAVLTVDAPTEEDAERARLTLDANGAIDVYKQAAPEEASPAALPAGTVDLAGRLDRVRDPDELDANGLTTH